MQKCKLNTYEIIIISLSPSPSPSPPPLSFLPSRTKELIPVLLKQG